MLFIAEGEFIVANYFSFNSLETVFRYASSYVCKNAKQSCPAGTCVCVCVLCAYAVCDWEIKDSEKSITICLSYDS